MRKWGNNFSFDVSFRCRCLIISTLNKLQEFTLNEKDLKQVREEKKEIRVGNEFSFIMPKTKQNKNLQIHKSLSEIRIFY